MKGCKTNINRHVCIIPGVIEDELSKRNFHMKYLRTRVEILKGQLWRIFIKKNRTLGGGAAGNVATYRIVVRGVLCLLFFVRIIHIVSDVKYLYRH